MAFLLRFLLYVGQIIIYFVVSGLALLAVIFVVNKTVQLVAKVLGYEVGDFISWFFSGVKRVFAKKKKRNKK